MKASPASWLLGLLLGSLAQAQERPAAATEPAPDAHRFTAYLHTGVSLYVSGARTLGGVGGGVGVRDTIDERFILQADARYVLGLGNALELRAGAGLQRRGTWTPAALVVLTGMVGEGLRFITPERSTPPVGPALSVGLQLSPLRFTHAGTQFSLFEFGLGVGSDWPGRGLSYHFTLLEAGTCF